VSAETVTIVRTGVANTASVVSAFKRLGARAVLTSERAEVERAERLVLPGVGSFGSIMQTLVEHGLVEALRERIYAGAPTLAICLGMQILGVSSEESPGVAGLGVIGGACRRFDARGVRVPQLGWNSVAPGPGCHILEPGMAYFANSYRLTEPPSGWALALTDYAGPFVSALEREGVLACQFHPELSGRWGLALIERWLVRTGAEVGAP